MEAADARGASSIATFIPRRTKGAARHATPTLRSSIASLHQIFARSSPLANRRGYSLLLHFQSLARALV